MQNLRGPRSQPPAIPGWHLGSSASKMTRPQETGSLRTTVSELGAKVKISGSLSPSLPIIHLLLGKDDEL